MSEWAITGWELRHPSHGSFHITSQRAMGRFSVQHSWRASPRSAVECEYVGAFAGFATLEAAQAAVEAYLVKLEQKPVLSTTCSGAAADASCVREEM